MESLRRSSFVETMRAVAEFLAANHHDRVVDQNLNIVEKRGFRWCLLSLLRPLYWLVGWDPYSHVRVYNVAKEIFRFYGEYQGLKTRPSLLARIQTEIVGRFNERTAGKYARELGDLSRQFSESLLPQLPPNYPETLSWPADLSSIGVTQTQKKAIVEAVSPLLSKVRKDPWSYSLKFIKEGEKGARVRRLVLIDRGQWDKEEVVQQQSVPLSFSLTYTSSPGSFVKDIVLRTKKKVGEGGQTQVRLLYNLTTGKLAVRKRCLTENGVQQFVIHHFQKNPSRGIIPILDLQKTGIKTHVVEPYYQHTLSSVLGTPICASFSVRLALIADLLHGLSTLHELKIPLFKYQDPTKFYLYKTDWDCVEDFKVCHYDLKLDNILILAEEKLVQAFITDFGAVSPVDDTGTIGFQSPERVVLNLGTPSKEQGKFIRIANFKKRDGQASDMWAMGILTAMILVNRRSSMGPGFPSLSCIEQAIKTATSIAFPGTGKSLLVEKDITKLTQKEIDESVDELEKKCLPNNPAIWGLVKKMLRILPEERISSSQAKADFEEIYTAYLAEEQKKA